jgi:hypothetical protein
MFDVGAHVMCGIGVAGSFAGGAHEFLDFVTVEERKGTRVVTVARAEQVITWNAEGVGAA